jgi:predicted MPP superfamily phosphohydrolase
MTSWFSGWQPHYETARIGWYVAFTVFWGSYVLVPALLWGVWRVLRRWAEAGWLRRTVGVVLLVVTALFTYARFIEPARITVHETRLGLGVSTRVALISDLHMGLFKGPAYLERVVDELNRLDVDAVLIAGDHNYRPGQTLDELLAPWKRSKHPVYSVPGNHDEEHPGPPLRRALREALQRNGVHTVEYEHVDMGSYYLVGIGDHYAHRDGMGPLAATPAGKPRVLLFHNPETIWHVPKGTAVLALAGHTHGGQIRLPYITRRMVGVLIKGFYPNTPVPLFITSGLGESHLPMRWNVPPVIDVLDLR